MSATDYCSDLHPDVVMPNHELLKIHRSKISLHCAKAGYSYPTIRLPHTFSALAGLPTRIYQTVHEGALAFLVVVSPHCTLAANRSEESARTSSEKPESSVFKSIAQKPATTIQRLDCRAAALKPKHNIRPRIIEVFLGFLSFSVSL
jgi:hypothetical protein